MKRRPAGDGAIYKRGDGLWCGQVDLGYIDGKRRRRTVYGKSQSVVLGKMQEARENARLGVTATANVTVEWWLTYWLEEIAAKKVKPGTLRTYRSYVDTHISPAIGKRRLDRLGPQHIRAMLDGMKTTSTSKLHAYTILSTALRRAMKDRRIPVNVATLVDAPRKQRSQRTGLSGEEARAVLTAALDVPMTSRWQAALMTGARQGELLGLRWNHVDLDVGKIEIAWSLQRVPYSHGCGGTCGTKRAASCPSKRLVIPDGMEAEPLHGNLYLLRPKSEGSMRVVPLLPALHESLRRHQEATADQPNPHGLVWHHPDGRPLDGRRDWQAWKSLLKAAGVQEVTLHEARNTVATLLMEAGVDPEVIKKMLGHTDVTVTRGYQHVRLDLMREAIGRLGARLEVA